MKLTVNLETKTRKELVAAISEVIGEASQYLGAPSFDFKVGDIIIHRDGTVESPQNHDALQSALTDLGFDVANTEPKTENTSIKIYTDNPHSKTLTNLKAIIDVKSELICAALDIPATPVVVREDMIELPWFTSEPKHLGVYTRLIQMIHAQAKTKQRVTAKPCKITNFKYSMRVFLISLGYVGDEFKEDRRVLLSKLEGNSAFRQ